MSITTRTGQNWKLLATVHHYIMTRELKYLNETFLELPIIVIVWLYLLAVAIACFCINGLYTRIEACSERRRIQTEPGTVDTSPAEKEESSRLDKTDFINLFKSSQVEMVSGEDNPRADDGSNKTPIRNIMTLNTCFVLFCFVSFRFVSFRFVFFCRKCPKTICDTAPRRMIWSPEK